MQIHAEEILKTKQRMTRLYAEHCGCSYEDFERAMDRDHFLTAEEAMEWGLIDKIMQVREMPANPYRIWSLGTGAGWKIPYSQATSIQR